MTAVKSVMEAKDTFVISNETSYSVHADSLQEARQLFIHAKKNLLHVASWQNIAGIGNVAFQLVDSEGKLIDRAAQPGDFIKIEIYGRQQAPIENWVKVVEVSDLANNTYHLQASIKVEPSVAPQKSSVSPFMNTSPISKLSVERIGSIVYAKVSGSYIQRKTDGILARVRQKLISIGTHYGLLRPEWGGLVKGMLRA